MFVTNHAFHNNLDAADTGVQCLATGFHINDFGPDIAYQGYKAVLDARERHPEMFDLLASMNTHYEIPSTFEGCRNWRFRNWPTRLSWYLAAPI